MDDDSCAFDDDWNHIFEDMIQFYQLTYESESENENLDIEETINKMSTAYKSNDI